MGSIVGSLAGSCAGSCCAGLTCAACKGLCSKFSYGGARIAYLVLFFLSVLLSGILRYWGKPLLVKVWIYEIALCTSENCYGYGAVYRITTAMTLFFLIMWCLTLSSGCVKAGADRSYWWIKVILFIGLVVLMWVLPPVVFNGFVRHLFRALAGVFVVVQIVLIVDFAYNWNSDWVNEKNWMVPTLVVAMLMYIGALVVLILFFHWFGRSGCATNQGLLVTTLILSLAFTGLSITEWCEHGALLPSAFVTLYLYWTLWSAFTDNHDHKCNPFDADSGAQVIIGLITSALSVTYAAYNLSNNTHALNVNANQESLLDKSYQNANGDTDEEADIPSPGEIEHIDLEQGKQSAKFHAVMVLAAAYAAMIFTEWGGVSEETAGGGKTSFWLKVAAQWVTILLYSWSLVAPYACPHRDFS